MSSRSRHDAWSAGESYELYMGRWSRDIARRFVALLGAPPGLDWLDIGCGTGALAATVLAQCTPNALLGVDPAEAFIAHARATIADRRVRFDVAGADALPCADRSIDMVVSALAYNFFPDRTQALREMQRVARPGATVAFYVWDYPGGGMGFIEAFWRAAVATDAHAAALVESRRFPFCTRQGLRREVVAAGLDDARVDALEVPTRFADFEAFWRPFTLGAGPAPGYCASLDEPARLVLKQTLMRTLGAGAPIELTARAWCVRARAG